MSDQQPPESSGPASYPGFEPPDAPPAPAQPGPAAGDAPQNPYGQPPQNPYGGQAPYGQAPYGQPPAYAAPRDPGRRPGTVTAAAWITIVSSALTAALMAITMIFLWAARDEMFAELEKDPNIRELNFDKDQVMGIAVGSVGLFVVWSLVAIVLAVMVLRRSQVGRILLAVSAAMTALLSLVSIMSLVTLVPLVAAGAVLVLLFVGGANEWFRARA